jgi:hypothetical protein
MVGGARVAPIQLHDRHPRSVAVSRCRHCGTMVGLRPMRVDGVDLLAQWDDDPGVAAALGVRGADWNDWPTELVRDVPWRELIIAGNGGRCSASCSSSTPSTKSRTTGVTWTREHGPSTSGSGRQAIYRRRLDLHLTPVHGANAYPTRQRDTNARLRNRGMVHIPPSG